MKHFVQNVFCMNAFFREELSFIRNKSREGETTIATQHIFETSAQTTRTSPQDQLKQ
jgi:hypothetical protein